MTYEEMKEKFKEYSEEFLEFEENVKNPLSKRPDLHAFILLDKLQPTEYCMIYASAHDEFFLNIDLDAIAEVITEEQIVELIACGVSLDTVGRRFSMFS